MMSLVITRWIKLWYSAPSGKTSGNSGGGKPPLGGGGSRAENSEMMPRAPSTSCRSMTSWRNFSIEVALEQRLAFDHDQHVVLARRKFVRNLLV